MILPTEFFNKDAQQLARDLLGKIICARYGNHWLRAQIIETEAYYLTDKASHASLGYTQKRKALFMHAGTIYMYYARGGDSLNVGARGPGNAVLIKSAIAYDSENDEIIKIMQSLNPIKNSRTNQFRIRDPKRLCSGQTLLCRSLNLKVKEWDQKQFDPEKLFIANNKYKPKEIIQTQRLGIPRGRDEHLPYRFIDANYITQITKK